LVIQTVSNDCFGQLLSETDSSDRKSDKSALEVIFGHCFQFGELITENTKGILNKE